LAGNLKAVSEKKRFLFLTTTVLSYSDFWQDTIIFDFFSDKKNFDWKIRFASLLLTNQTMNITKAYTFFYFSYYFRNSPGGFC